MKITKKKLFELCDENNDAINELQSQSDSTNFALAVLIQQLKDSGVIDEISPEPKPQPEPESELTGSELCKAMLERGDKIVLCIVKDYEHESNTYYDAITHCSRNYFELSLSTWGYAAPINNQGEPLTASEVGL